MYGNDYILNWTAARRVGICTISPSYTLDVTGNTRSTTTITAGQTFISGAY